MRPSKKSLTQASSPCSLDALKYLPRGKVPSIQEPVISVPHSRSAWDHSENGVEFQSRGQQTERSNYHCKYKFCQLPFGYRVTSTLFSRRYASFLGFALSHRGRMWYVLFPAVPREPLKTCLRHFRDQLAYNGPWHDLLIGPVVLNEGFVKRTRSEMIPRTSTKFSSVEPPPPLIRRHLRGTKKFVTLENNGRKRRTGAEGWIPSSSDFLVCVGLDLEHTWKVKRSDIHFSFVTNSNGDSKDSKGDELKLETLDNSGFQNV